MPSRELPKSSTAHQRPGSHEGWPSWLSTPTGCELAGAYRAKGTTSLCDVAEPGVCSLRISCLDSAPSADDAKSKELMRSQSAGVRSRCPQLNASRHPVLHRYGAAANISALPTVDFSAGNGCVSGADVSRATRHARGGRTSPPQAVTPSCGHDGEIRQPHAAGLESAALSDERAEEGVLIA